MVDIALRIRPTLRGTVGCRGARLAPARRRRRRRACGTTPRSSSTARASTPWTRRTSPGPPRSPATRRRPIPEHVLAFYLLGQASLAQSRWEDAAQALAKVTTLYPARGRGPARPRRGVPAARAHRRSGPRLGGGARHPARGRRHARAPGDHARQCQSAGAGAAAPDGARRAQHQAARRVPRDGARRLRHGRLRGCGGGLREGGGAQGKRPDVVQPRRGARAPGQHGGRARGVRARRPVPGHEGAGGQGDPEGQGGRGPPPAHRDPAYPAKRRRRIRRAPALEAGCSRADRPLARRRVDRQRACARPPRGARPAPRRAATPASSRSAR